MTENTRWRLRIQYEKSFLEKYFNGEKFPLKRRGEEYIFERHVGTSTGSLYRLRVYVGPNYPRQLPELVVCDSPKPMPQSDEWKGTHTTHTWPPKDGFLRICYFRPACWTPRNKLYEVFNKGEEWLEAYEKYLATGKPMNETLVEMEPSEEEVREQRRIDNALLDIQRLFWKRMRHFLGSFVDPAAAISDHLTALEPPSSKETISD